MDPNATLTELRELTLRVFAEVSDADHERMAELFHSLDGWISRGGFLPTVWSKTL